MIYLLSLTLIFLFFEISEISFHFHKEGKKYIFEIIRKIDSINAKISFYFHKSDMFNGYFTSDTIYSKWISRYHLDIMKISKYNMENHIFNSFFWLMDNKKSIKNLLIAIIFSFLCLVINILSNNWLYVLIQQNYIFQTIIIFLTIITFMNLFTSAGFKGPISNRKIKEIIEDRTQEIEKNNKIIEENKKRFTVE